MNDTKQQLASLHAHLATLQSVDSDTRQQLMVLLADISRLLHADADAPSSGHTPALETLAAKFDVEHPALSNALRQLVDALAKAGI